MSVSGNEVKGPSTQERLASIVDGFNDFDSEMKIGTRQRREKDEFRIAELKNEMERLDRELTAEIKRRTEMNKSTQMWFEQQLTNVNKVFHTTLNERSVATNNRLDDINVKMGKLDEKFMKEKEEIINYINLRGEELSNMLEKFKDEFEKDRLLRLEREACMAKQLSDHEEEVAHSFDLQINSREERYIIVKKTLEDNIKLRDKSSERFQTFFEREIHKLHNDVRVESEIREREDDEIVEALNRYTSKLQSSLKIVNSTDM